MQKKTSNTTEMAPPLAQDAIVSASVPVPSLSEFLPERVSLLYRLSGGDTPLILLTAGIAALTLWGAVELRLLVAWGIWLIAGAGIRFALSTVYRRVAPPPERAGDWESYFCLASTLIGGSWGAALLVLQPARGSVQEMAVTFLISSLSMGLPPSLAPSPKAFASFVLPILVPLVALFFSQGGSVNTTAGLLVLLYAAVLLGIYVSAHRALLETLAFGRENARLAKQLGQAKERLDLAVQASAMSVWEWTVAEGSTFLDSGWRQILRESPQETVMTNEQFMASVHPEDAPAFKKALVECLKGRKADLDMEYRIRTGRGDWLWIKTRGKVAERDAAGRAVRMVGTHVDINARKLAEAETFVALQREKEMNEMKSRFVSMASHEFRTPLSTILSSSEILEHYSDSLEPNERVEQLKSIQTSVMRMTEMINGVLLLGKKDSGVLRFNPAEGDLEAACQRIITEVKGVDGDKHPIEFTYEVARREFQLDEQLLHHILGNLLTNALKYSDPGTVVRFQVVERDGWIAMIVSDQGIGIPESDLPRLFESFHRASNVGQRPGTGLGMSIVKSAVELHGGTLEVHSRVGEGTRFTVLLPQN